MIHVVNRHTYKGEHGPGEYVGRPSPLGNPYTHDRRLAERDGLTLVPTLADAINAYRDWLIDNIQTDTPQRREIYRMVDLCRRKGVLVLMCSCTPAPCHAEVVKEVIENILKRHP